MHPQTHPMFEELMSTVEHPGDELAAARAYPDLTIGELLCLHRRVFGFTYNLDEPHELAHVLLGLIGFKRYQGDYEGECLTLAIEDVLDEAMSGKNIWSEDQLGDRARKYFPEFVGDENLIRTLKYLLGREISRDPHVICANVAYEGERLTDMAEKKDILVSELPSTNTPSRAWTIETGTAGYSFDGNPENPVCNLPPGVVPMRMQTDAEINQIFTGLNRVMPVLIDTLIGLGDKSPDGVVRDLLDNHTRIKQALMAMPASLLLDNIDPVPMPAQKGPHISALPAAPGLGNAARA